MTTHTDHAAHVGTDHRAETASAGTRRWRLDPDRSLLRFSVPNYWGLTRVSGQFSALEGTLDLRELEPEVELRVQAGSVDSGNRRLDRHLRSPDYFDAERHPEVRCSAREATLSPAADALRVNGELHAAGRFGPDRAHGEHRCRRRRACARSRGGDRSAQPGDDPQPARHDPRAEPDRSRWRLIAEPGGAGALGAPNRHYTSGSQEA